MNQTLTLHLCLMTTTLLSTFKAIAQGGSVALVTATHQSIADKIANHLKIFDEVHGSHDDNNLKGLAKANFLAKRFGKGNFCYMGDTASDLPVWKMSGKVVTVNAKGHFADKQTFGKPIEHLKTFTHSWHPYYKRCVYISGRKIS